MRMTEHVQALRSSVPAYKRCALSVYVGSEWALRMYWTSRFAEVQATVCSALHKMGDCFGKWQTAVNTAMAMAFFRTR